MKITMVFIYCLAYAQQHTETHFVRHALTLSPSLISFSSDVNFFFCLGSVQNSAKGSVASAVALHNYISLS